MADRIEKEEFGDDKGLHEHDRARSDNSEETDYVHRPDCIEDNIPWTSQRAFKEGHFRAVGFEKSGGKFCRKKYEESVLYRQINAGLLSSDYLTKLRRGIDEKMMKREKVNRDEGNRVLWVSIQQSEN